MMQVHDNIELSWFKHPPQLLHFLQRAAYSLKPQRHASSHAKQHQSQEKSQASRLRWGRSHRPSAFYSLVMMILAPVAVLYFVVSCDQYQCNLNGVPRALATVQSTDQLWALLSAWAPRPTMDSALIWMTWFLFQALLYIYIPPSVIGKGQLTPAGHTLSYNVNGLRSFFLSSTLFILGGLCGVWRLSIIANHWLGLVFMANIAGYSLTVFCYIKAYFFPTHPDDCKFSGNTLYDLYMGIEFNPRIGEMFDLKLFLNGRPGIVAWPLITLSFAAAQREAIGYITNAMLLVLALHTLYVVDFFYNEDWYLRTIDIAHDHMGFYLCWGDMVWLPVMYTLQGQYLYRNPKDLPWWAVVLIVLIGSFGYFLFRSTNAQKDLARATNGQCQIWGKEPKLIRAKYTTADGKDHTSILLCSGWWGVARQVNYLGDLGISLAACLCCGWSKSPLLGYFYVFWMAGLLVHRTYRSEQRCKAKYGNAWESYCQMVPYKIVPYLF